MSKNFAECREYSDLIISIASMRVLEHRRCIMSLSLVYKSINGLAPLYISSFFKPRITHYNLRGNGHTYDKFPILVPTFIIHFHILFRITGTICQIQLNNVQLKLSLRPLS